MLFQEKNVILRQNIMGAEEISHKAYVAEVRSDSLLVRVVEQPDCGSCVLMRFCGSGNGLEIEVLRGANSIYFVGEQVEVYSSVRFRYGAVLLFFICPVVAILLSIGVCSAMDVSEIKSAVIALSVVVIWFGALYLFRKKLTKRIEWRVR